MPKVKKRSAWRKWARRAAEFGIASGAVLQKIPAYSEFGMGIGAAASTYLYNRNITPETNKGF